MYYGQNEADEAEAEFDKIFISKEIPDDIPEYQLENGIDEIGILDLIVKVNFAPSKGEARRLVTQGGVLVDGEKITDIAAKINLTKESILKVGKRKFIKIKKVS